MSITGATKSFAVLGDPISQSLSPAIHNFWMKGAGLDAVYTALHVQSDKADRDITALYRAGLAGLNVTAPHKSAALEASDSANELCRRIGAANTLVRGEFGWRAFNTDVEGFKTALSAAIGHEQLKDMSVVMIGAGGAARAAVAALFEQEAGLTILNRTRQRAVVIAEELSPGAKTAGLEDAATVLRQADIVINATSMGHGGTMLELPNGNGGLVFDLSYGKAAEPFLAAAKQEGWRTEDGLRMLVEQARAAFKLWFDIDPDPESALAVCRGKLNQP